MGTRLCGAWGRGAEQASLWEVGWGTRPGDQPGARRVLEDRTGGQILLGTLELSGARLRPNPLAPE